MREEGKRRAEEAKRLGEQQKQEMSQKLEAEGSTASGNGEEQPELRNKQTASPEAIPEIS